MNKKLVCLSLAGLMAMQSTAYAGTDRTSVVTKEAIAQAQSNIDSLRVNLGQLDQALAQTAEQVEKRDHSGGITNAVTIIGAGIGLGFSALSVMTAFKGGEGSGIGALLGISVSLISTIATVAMGTTSSALKKDIETGKVDKDLAELQSQIDAGLKSSDKSTSAMLQQLAVSVAGMRESLAAYQKSEDNTDRVKLGSHVAQGLGAALVVIGFRNRDTGNASMKLGFILMNAGNLGRIISGMSSSQADAVIREIKLTRVSIQSVAKALE